MFEVWTRPTPGAEMACTVAFASREDAQAVADAVAGRRKDLRWQDVEIRLNGKLVGYAGPAV